MTSSSVELNEASRQLLSELTAQTGQTPAAVIEKALDAYRRQVFFDQVNAGYAALRADSQAWIEELQDRKVWDASLMDGLDPAERWTECESGRSGHRGSRDIQDRQVSQHSRTRPGLAP